MNTIAHGLVAGVIGYATVALLGIGVSVLSGESPFYTAAVLGAMLTGDGIETGVVVTPAHVLAYNGAHLLVFLAFGVVGSWLASIADHGNHLWYVALCLFMFIGFLMIVVAQTFSEPARAALSEAAIWLGGIVASLAMGTYLVLVHPKLRAVQRWDA